MKVLSDLRSPNGSHSGDRATGGSLCDDLAANLKSGSKSYPKGAVLFLEGGSASGVFILRRGRVKLSTCSTDGKVITVGIATPGDVLGLGAVMNSGRYETAAEALEDCSVDLIHSSDLVAYLRRDAGASFHAALELGKACRDAQMVISSLVTAQPVLIRLARLFLSWAPDGNGGGPIRVTNTFTHQQLAEMIGTTRETVTRSLRELRERDVATLKGRDLVIHHHERLRLMTANGDGHCDSAHRQENIG